MSVWGVEATHKFTPILRNTGTLFPVLEFRKRGRGRRTLRRIDKNITSMKTSKISNLRKIAKILVIGRWRIRI